MITESGYADKCYTDTKRIKKLHNEGREVEAVVLSLELSKREVKAVEHYLNEIIKEIPPLNGMEMQYFVVALKILQNITWELNKNKSAEILYEIASHCLSDGISMGTLKTGNIGGHNE